MEWERRRAVLWRHPVHCPTRSTPRNAMYIVLAAFFLFFFCEGIGRRSSLAQSSWPRHSPNKIGVQHTLQIAYMYYSHIESRDLLCIKSLSCSQQPQTFSLLLLLLVATWKDCSSSILKQSGDIPFRFFICCKLDSTTDQCLPNTWRRTCKQSW